MAKSGSGPRIPREVVDYATELAIKYPRRPNQTHKARRELIGQKIAANADFKRRGLPIPKKSRLDEIIKSADREQAKEVPWSFGQTKTSYTGPTNEAIFAVWRHSLIWGLPFSKTQAQWVAAIYRIVPWGAAKWEANDLYSWSSRYAGRELIARAQDNAPLHTEDLDASLVFRNHTARQLLIEEGRIAEWDTPTLEELLDGMSAEEKLAKLRRQSEVAGARSRFATANLAVLMAYQDDPNGDVPKALEKLDEESQVLLSLWLARLMPDDGEVEPLEPDEEKRLLVQLVREVVAYTKRPGKFLFGPRRDPETPFWPSDNILGAFQYTPE